MVNQQTLSKLATSPDRSETLITSKCGIPVLTNQHVKHDDHHKEEKDYYHSMGTNAVGTEPIAYKIIAASL